MVAAKVGLFLKQNFQDLLAVCQNSRRFAKMNQLLAGEQVDKRT
jgi:hypothetical protein